MLTFDNIADKLFLLMREKAANGDKGAQEFLTVQSSKGEEPEPAEIRPTPPQPPPQ